MKYQYLVLESDAPGVPAEMLNEQGEEGWEMCGVVTRDVRPPEEGKNRWIFYFVKEVD